MATIVTDADDLRAYLQQTLLDVLEEVLPPLIRQYTAKEWYTQEEVTELTGWSRRTLQNLRDTRQIPFTQHGRKILYPREGIEAFLRANHIRSRKP